MKISPPETPAPSSSTTLPAMVPVAPPPCAASGAGRTNERRETEAKAKRTKRRKAVITAILHPCRGSARAKPPDIVRAADDVGKETCGVCRTFGIGQAAL